MKSWAVFFADSVRPTRVYALAFVLQERIHVLLSRFETAPALDYQLSWHRGATVDLGTGTGIAIRSCTMIKDPETSLEIRAEGYRLPVPNPFRRRRGVPRRHNAHRR